MSFQVEQTYIIDIENFKWEDWRAMVLSKEQRRNKDYYFASLIRFYGNEEGSFDYDIGNKSDELAFIGRKEVFVGERGPDKDPKSKTFGQRITFPAQTEEQEYLDHGVEKTRTVLVKGRKVYEFNLPVNEKNTLLVKKLIGPLTVNKQTTFQMLAGTQRPVSVSQDIFFSKSVDDIMTEHLSLLASKQKKK